jgi:hypothetical protein
VAEIDGTRVGFARLLRAVIAADTSVRRGTTSAMRPRHLGMEVRVRTRLTARPAVEDSITRLGWSLDGPLAALAGLDVISVRWPGEAVSPAGRSLECSAQCSFVGVPPVAVSRTLSIVNIPKDVMEVWGLETNPQEIIFRSDARLLVPDTS